VRSDSRTPERRPLLPRTRKRGEAEGERTSELRVTLADHAAGNYRVMMNLGDELLAAAAERELARLDEKLFLEVFAHAPKPKVKGARKR
jgi:hypothetical protein